MCYFSKLLKIPEIAALFQSKVSNGEKENFNFSPTTLELESNAFTLIINIKQVHLVSKQKDNYDNRSNLTDG